MRRASSDVPTRAPIRRRGIVKARQNASLYLVNTPAGCLAFWEGPSAIALNTEVTIEFDPVIPAWWIVS